MQDIMLDIRTTPTNTTVKCNDRGFNENSTIKSGMKEIQVLLGHTHRTYRSSYSKHYQYRHAPLKLFLSPSRSSGQSHTAGFKPIIPAKVSQVGYRKGITERQRSVILVILGANVGKALVKRQLPKDAGIDMF
jgi:hypothetical protein